MAFIFQLKGEWNWGRHANHSIELYSVCFFCMVLYFMQLQNPAHLSLIVGVLQGESLSPLLFISDMEQFLRAQGCVGLSITLQTDCLMLMFADDAVMIGYSEGDIQRKVNILHKYCTINKLTVNVGKTNAMINSKKAKWSKTNFRFMFNDQEEEKV